MQARRRRLAGMVRASRWTLDAGLSETFLAHIEQQDDRMERVGAVRSDLKGHGPGYVVGVWCGTQLMKLTEELSLPTINSDLCTCMRFHRINVIILHVSHINCLNNEGTRRT